MNKQFIGAIVVIVGLMFGLFYFTKSDTVDPGKAGLQLGQDHEDQGRDERQGEGRPQVAAVRGCAGAQVRHAAIIDRTYEAADFRT